MRRETEKAEGSGTERRVCFCCCIQDLKKHCPNGQIFEICLTSYNVYFKNCAKSCKTPKKTLAISKNSSIIKARNPTGLQRIFFGKRGNLCIKSVFLRLVSAVLALCMMAALLPTAAFAADPLSPGTTFPYTHQGQTLKYTVNADGTTVSVAMQGIDVVSVDVVIPATVYDSAGTSYSVTSIGELAFYYCISMASIVIPTSVTSIGKEAFYGCFALTSVAFAENSKLTSIGDSAFYDCFELTSVTFAENSKLASIGNNAFAWCSKLESVEIPSGVTSIGDKTFRSTGLTSIVIPASVTSIGNEAFSKCINLSSVTFEDKENSKLTRYSGQYAQ